MEKTKESTIEKNLEAWYELLLTIEAGKSTKSKIVEAKEHILEETDMTEAETKKIDKIFTDFILYKDEELKNFFIEYKLKPKSSEEVNILLKRFRNYLVHYKKLQTRIDEVLDGYKNFDKNKCFANIRALLKKNPDVKIGQIEKEANLRLGYMSRLEKPDNTSEPTMEFILSAAKLLGVSVDYLLNANLDELTPNEDYFIKFIDSILKDTRDDVLCWKKEVPEKFNRLFNYDKDPGYKHPLFTDDEEDIDSLGNPHIARYISFFYPDNPVAVTSTVYSANLPGTDSSIYIVPCTVYEKEDETDELAELEDYTRTTQCIEMYIASRRDINPLCNTRLTCNYVIKKVEDLYNTVRDASSRVQLNQTTKDIMAFYMNNRGTTSNVVDEPVLPFD